MLEIPASCPRERSGFPGCVSELGIGEKADRETCTMIIRTAERSLMFIYMLVTFGSGEPLLDILAAESGALEQISAIFSC